MYEIIDLLVVAQLDVLEKQSFVMRKPLQTLRLNYR